jgi:hypothetical protein
MNWWSLTSVVDNTFSWKSGDLSSNPAHASLNQIVIHCSSDLLTCSVTCSHTHPPQPHCSQPPAGLSHSLPLALKLQSCTAPPSSPGRASSTALSFQSCDNFSISLRNPVPRLGEGGAYVADSGLKLGPDYYELVVPR